MKNIKVDFSKNVKPMKPLHGVNNGPVHGNSMGVDNTAEFVELGIPYARLHDAQYPFGMGCFVDIHCIFRNFDADPTDPNSYDFDMTDLYLQKIFEAGANVIYRLGESIEHLPKKYHVHPPKDYVKWSQICEGIIRHYTEGWANGFTYPIEYWEIWNEPDNPGRMWTGTDEEYFELYYVASNYLKARFPHLKIGGYGACGFYEITKRMKWHNTQHCMDFVEGFFEYITREDKKCPLDFFSWHIYFPESTEHVVMAQYVDTLLGKYGFKDTESIITEWNVSEDFLQTEPLDGPVVASIVASVLGELQRKTSVKIANYYDVGNNFWNGLYTDDHKHLKGFYAMKAYNALYRLGNESAITEDTENKTVFCCAASDGESGGVLLSNTGEDATVKLSMTGLQKNTPVTAEVYYTNANHDGEMTRSEIFFSDVYSMVLKMEKGTIVYISVREAVKEEL